MPHQLRGGLRHLSLFLKEPLTLLLAVTSFGVDVIIVDVQVFSFPEVAKFSEEQQRPNRSAVKSFVFSFFNAIT